jgi:adenosylmethionine-8-amino-7-oxononanoate aminotransferase
MSFHYWRNRGHADKRSFVSLAGSYHGETIGALAVTDVAIFRDAYAPSSPRASACRHRWTTLVRPQRRSMRILRGITPRRPR